MFIIYEYKKRVIPPIWIKNRTDSVLFFPYEAFVEISDRFNENIQKT